MRSQFSRESVKAFCYGYLMLLCTNANLATILVLIAVGALTSCSTPASHPVTETLSRNGGTPNWLDRGISADRLAAAETLLRSTEKQLAKAELLDISDVNKNGLMTSAGTLRAEIAILDRDAVSASMLDQNTIARLKERAVQLDYRLQFLVKQHAEITELGLERYRAVRRERIERDRREMERLQKIEEAFQARENQKFLRQLKQFGALPLDMWISWMLQKHRTEILKNIGAPDHVVGNDQEWWYSEKVLTPTTLQRKQLRIKFSPSGYVASIDAL